MTRQETTSLNNQNCSITIGKPSIKPCQVFIGADTDYELTFGLDHSMGAGQQDEHPWTLSRLGSVGTCSHNHQTEAEAVDCWGEQDDPDKWALVRFSEPLRFGGFIPVSEALR